jgi:hypothetical protein
LPGSISYAQTFRQYYAVVARHDSVGAITTQNHVIIPFAYHLLEYLGQERFLFGYRDRYFGEYQVGVLTSANVQLTPPHYRSVTVHGTQYVVCRTKDSLLTGGPYQGARAVRSFYGLLSAIGQSLLPCQ